MSISTNLLYILQTSSRQLGNSDPLDSNTRKQKMPRNKYNKKRRAFILDAMKLY